MTKDKPLDSIIGLYCIESRSSLIGMTIFEFSRCSDKLSLLIQDFDEVEYTMVLVSAAWRLSADQVLVTGSYENTESKDAGLRKLLGCKLEKVQYNNHADLSLFFENGYRIDTFQQSEDFPVMELFYRGPETAEPNVISLEASGKWVDADDSGLTDDEKLAATHSENTEMRWRLMVPPDSPVNHCANCAYFLSTSGRFYFWDFGMCSNRKSNYDGQAVGAKSTCDRFRRELDADDL